MKKITYSRRENKKKLQPEMQASSLSKTKALTVDIFLHSKTFILNFHLSRNSTEVSSDCADPSSMQEG